jgi:hypothetical protein
MSFEDWVRPFAEEAGENHGALESSTDILQKTASEMERAQVHYEGFQEGEIHMLKESAKTAFDSKSPEDIYRDNEAGERFDRTKDNSDSVLV